MNLIQNLESRKLITPPKWLNHSIGYMVIGGSTAYGTNLGNSDQDTLGWCIPPKEDVFRTNEIPGFGKQKKRFEQYLQHGIVDKDRGKSYDITLFSIVKFFNLVMENNPSCLELLYVAQDCVLICTEIGQMVRDNRRLFLNKNVYNTCRGYSYSQLHKMSSQERTGKRKELYETHGFDVKFGLNVVRLLLQCEQLLIHNDMDLRRDSEYLKAIRRGEVPESDIVDFFNSKEKELEKLYHESKLPWGPDESAIKDLLLKCLEHHYGSLDKCVERLDKYEIATQKIREILDTL